MTITSNHKQANCQNDTRWLKQASVQQHAFLPRWSFFLAEPYCRLHFWSHTCPLLLLLPFSADYKSPQSAGLSQRQLLRGSETEPNTCYAKGIPRLANVQRGVPCVHGRPQSWCSGGEMIWRRLKISAERWPFLVPRCLRQWADHANAQTDSAGEDGPDPSLWLCHPFQVSATVCCLCSCRTDIYSTITGCFKQVPEPHICFITWSRV